MHASSAKQSVMVTGGASGIGAAAATLLAVAGHHVTIVDMAGGRGERVAAQLADDHGASTQFVAADICDEAEVEAAVATAVATFGRLDGAINAAGVSALRKSLVDLTVEDWERCIRPNLLGMFLCMKHQVRAMLDGGGGSVVALSSAAAERGFPATSEYSASKAGIGGLVRSAATEYARRGVRINAVMPGTTNTPMIAESLARDPAGVQAAVDLIPIGRLAEPSEIAAACVWLVSSDSSYVTGTVIPVDGAMVIG